MKERRYMDFMKILILFRFISFMKVPPDVEISSEPEETSLAGYTDAFFIRNTEYNLTCQAQGKPTPR